MGGWWDRHPPAIPLSHYPTIPLSHYPTIPLSHYPNGLRSAVFRRLAATCVANERHLDPNRTMHVKRSIAVVGLLAIAAGCATGGGGPYLPSSARVSQAAPIGWPVRTAEYVD